MSADRLQDIVDWLIDGARSAPEPTEKLGQLCDRLVACGIPLWRVGLFIRTLHPDVFGRSFIWRLGQAVEAGAADFTLPDTEEFQTSPLHVAIATSKMVRHRLTQNAPLHSLVLEDLRAQGITDYVAFPLIFTDRSVHVISMQTKELAGFSEGEIGALLKIVPPLARVVEVETLRRTAATLLDTYVGNRTGARILAGQIRRGHTDTLHAAIWLSDLRGFTALSDRLPPTAVVDLLNRYFDCQVPSIVNAGGEVLKFMGDGLLAVFPTADDGKDEREVCEKRARRGARGARRGQGAHVHGQRPSGRTAEFRARPACRRRALRQYRQPPPPRLHLHRPRGQPGRPHGKADRQPRPHDPCFDGVCKPHARRLDRYRRIRGRGFCTAATGVRAARRRRWCLPGR